MTIEKIEAKFFEAEVKKLLDFFPELKEEDFLLLSENDTRRRKFWEVFPLISENNEMEIVSVKKAGNGLFEFETKSDDVLFRDAMPTDSELKSLDV
ncbi:MAG: hypothetical protein MJZ50_07565 [Treponema sp.]|nr:hypothetical protein [Treponema sp.]